MNRLTRLLNDECGQFIVPPVPTSGLSAHPRIWLTPSILADVHTKRLAADADWTTTKNRADTIVNTLALPQCTITGATNAATVTFTCTENIPFSSTSYVYMAGATGNWATVNTPRSGTNPAPRIATKTGTKTFTIPVDSTTFGAFGGQNVNVFVFDESSPAGYLEWAQYGDGYMEALLELAIVYKELGTTTYRDKALAIIDFVNTMGAAGNWGPQSIDAGRAGTQKSVALAIAYDWLFADLSSVQRTATIVTLNMWATWTTVGLDGTGPAFALHDVGSNYWEMHQLFLTAVAYATYDENASAQSWLTTAQTNWSTYFVPAFNAPTEGARPYDSPGVAMYYGGMTPQGWNYGGNDKGRHVLYFLMVKSATGSEPTGATSYAQRWVRAQIHELKPSRYKSVTWGRWPGNYYGVMNLSCPMMLASFLDGTTEGGWMQWQYTNWTPGSGIAPSDLPQFAAIGAVIQAGVISRLLFYKSSRTQIDYTSTESTYAAIGGTNYTTYWRSDWTTSGVYSYFRSVPGNGATGEAPQDAGHIDVTRGDDYLLVQSDDFKGTTDGLGPNNPQIFENNGAFANTLYFWDGGDNGGAGPGHCLAQGSGSSYDGCQTHLGKYRTPAIKQTANYTFVENNFASQYDYNQTAAQRTLNYFFRAYLAMGDGTFIVWDRIRSTLSTHTKQIRWHLPATNAPVVGGGTISSSIGSSKVIVYPVLPASTSVVIQRNHTTVQNYTDLVIDATTATKMTSAAHPFTASDVGRAVDILSGTGWTVQQVIISSVSAAVATCDTALGTLSSTGGNGVSGNVANYRALVTETTPAGDLNMLSVAYATATGGSLPTTTSLGTIDSNFVGVQVADTTPKVAVFPKGTDVFQSNYTSHAYSTTSFTTTHSGTGNYVVAGLAAGTYSIVLGGVTIYTGQVVGSDGTLYFTSASGAFVVS